MGEEQDLAAYVAARGPALLRLAWLLTADAQAAEDQVQEALAKTIPRRIGIAGETDYARPWTPPLTRHPMASMVLQTPIAVGAHSVEGPILVSADGRQYAGLPWSKCDSQVALSADGTEVAWVSQGSAPRTGPAQAVVHWIRLQANRPGWFHAARAVPLRAGAARL